MKRTARGLLRVIGALAVSPYLVPRTIYRGFRGFIEDTNTPIDLVRYYETITHQRKTLQQNLAKIMSIVVVILVGLKLYVVSDGNSETVLHLLGSISTPQVLTVLALAILPNLVTFLQSRTYPALRPGGHPRNVTVQIWTAYFIITAYGAIAAPAVVTGFLIITPIGHLFWRGVSFKSAPEDARVERGASKPTYQVWMEQKHQDVEQRAIADRLREEEALLRSTDSVATKEAINTRINVLIERANRRTEEIHKAVTESGWATAVSYISFATLLLLPALVSKQPWLPSESIALKSQDRIVGYFVQESGGWASILKDEPRLIVHVRTEEIASRTPCGPNGEIKSIRTLVQVVTSTDGAVYPKCPAN